MIVVDVLFEAELAHQALNGLVVDLLSRLSDGQSDVPVAIPPLVAGMDGSDLLLQSCIFVACLGRFLLIAEGTAWHASELKQCAQREIRP